MTRELAYWEAVDLYRQHCLEQRRSVISQPDEHCSQLAAGGIWYLRNAEALVATVDTRTGDVCLAPSADAHGAQAAAQDAPRPSRRAMP